MTRPKPGFECMRFLECVTDDLILSDSLKVIIFILRSTKSLGRPSLENEKKSFFTFLSMGKKKFLLGKLINF